MAKFTEIACIFQKLHVKFVKAYTVYKVTQSYIKNIIIEY